MEQPITVGGVDRYDVVRAIGDARRTLAAIADGFATAIEKACVALYHEHGISGILISEKSRMPHRVTLCYLEQTYKIVSEIVRHQLGWDDAQEASYEYYLAISALKRIERISSVDEVTWRDGDGTSWRSLTVNRYIDAGQAVYREADGHDPGVSMKDAIPEFIVDLLVEFDCT